MDELVYKQNAVKGYEAEAEECLKKEFKDWLEGKHMDNLVPHTRIAVRASSPDRGASVRNGEVEL